MNLCGSEIELGITKLAVDAFVVAWRRVVRVVKWIQIIDPIMPLTFWMRSLVYLTRRLTFFATPSALRTVIDERPST